ncbi:MAG: hypothetical protein WC718_17430, partial [Phycisphaerales bacterium]
CGAILSDPASVAIIVPSDPPCGCETDYNEDGNSDLDDVEYLMYTIGGENTPPLDPDFNRDGNVDQGDIDALINTIAGGGCP